MQLGIGSYALAWSIGVPGSPPPRPLTARDLLRKAGELGVRVVQICDNLPLDPLGSDEIDRLAEEAEQLGVRIEVGTRGIAPDHLQTYLRLARRLKSPILRVVIDAGEHKPSLDEAIDILRPQMSAFEEAGVLLAIENHDRFAARQFVELVERLESPAAGICLDTVNSFGALEGPEVVVSTLQHLVVNLHLKDFTVRRADHMMGFLVEGCPAGTGRLDIVWLLETLGASRCEGISAILEQWPPPLASIEETIAREQAWAAESVARLRLHIPR